MKESIPSRSSFLIAVYIVFIYILALLLKGYAFSEHPAEENSISSILFSASSLLCLFSTILTLLCSIAILYSFLVITMYCYDASPVSAIAAFLGVFLFFFIKGMFIVNCVF